MKTKIKKCGFTTIPSVIIICLAFCSCNKYLDRPPLDNVPEQDFFQKASNLELYINQFYQPSTQLLDYGGTGALVDYSALMYYREDGTDNEAQQSINTRTNGQTIVPSTASKNGWDFSWVRKVNYFLNHYQECQDPFSSYEQYVGEAHFFRAIIYFSLLRQFGSVPWFSQVVGLTSPELQASRTPRNIVVDSILADLDTAAMYMTDQRNDNGLQLDKWCALALESRVALYEGTWEKYHTGDPFDVPNPDPQKYLEKCVQASEEVMQSGDFNLYSTGHPNTDFHDFFNLPDYSTDREVIMWKQFDKSQNVKEYRTITLAFPSGWGVTKSLVDAFLCKDGKPISTSPLFMGYSSYDDVIMNRDPRLAQTIVTPEDPYDINSAGDTLSTWGSAIFPILYASSTTSSTTGYLIYKGFNANESAQDKSGNNEPAILFRYAEVLLNYAEAKAELGTISQSDLDETINLLRDRVGMPHLILNKIPTDPKWQFPNLSPIINEIRRERRVELALEGFRWDDIMRWNAAGSLLAGQRPKGILFGKQYSGDTYPNDSQGFMDPFQSAIPNGYGFNINRDYLLPIPKDELTMNHNLQQNPGW